MDGRIHHSTKHRPLNRRKAGTKGRENVKKGGGDQVEGSWMDGGVHRSN